MSNSSRWFPEAGRLQVSAPDWTTEAGEVKPGKTVSVNISSLAGNPEAVRIFKEVLQIIQDDMEVA